MQDRPTAQELLATIGDLLQGEVLDATSGPLKHQVRVAGNLCRILEREIEHQPVNDARASLRMAEILGTETIAGDLEELNRTLAARLRPGADFDANDPSELEFERRAFPVLLEIVRGKLDVNKPGHDAYDFEPETAGEVDR